jgi:hypothetical protein
LPGQIGLLITVLEFLLYKQFMDPFYKKVEGHNLVGVRKPRGDVKRRIVISGHIDAAYEWRHILYGKKEGNKIFNLQIFYKSHILSFHIKDKRTVAKGSPFLIISLQPTSQKQREKPL